MKSQHRGRYLHNTFSGAMVNNVWLKATRGRVLEVKIGKGSCFRFGSGDSQYGSYVFVLKVLKEMSIFRFQRLLLESVTWDAKLVPVRVTSGIFPFLVSPTESPGSTISPSEE